MPASTKETTAIVLAMSIGVMTPRYFTAAYEATPQPMKP